MKAPAVSKPVVMKALKTTLVISLGVKLVMRLFQPVKRWRLRRVPGPWYKPLVGDSLSMLTGDIATFMTDLCAKYNTGPLVQFWECNEAFVLVRDAQLGKEMLNQHVTRKHTQVVAWARDKERRPWENVLLFINDEKWAQCRRGIEEDVAQAAALHAHIPSMQAAVERLLQVLDKHSRSGTPVDVFPCVVSMTLDVIVKAVFGLDVHACGLGSNLHQDPAAVLLGAAAALGVGVKASEPVLLTPEQLEDGWWDTFPLESPEFGRRLVSSVVGMLKMLWTCPPVGQMLYLAIPEWLPLWRLLARLLPDKNTRLQRKLIRGIQLGCCRIMAHWKAEHLTQAGEHVGSRSMIRHLTQAAQDGTGMLDEDVILGTVITAVMGGYDTGGSTLAMSLHFLSTHLNVQSAAHQEVDNVLGDKVPELSDLKNLPYITAVLNETLRLASPSPLAARRAVTEYVHPGGAFRLPAGTSVWFPLHVYHRDPSIWPRADEFLPERYIQPGNEHMAPSDMTMFFPFGAGPRKCPGYKFAMQELRLALARLLQRFEFLPVEGCPEPQLRFSMVRNPDHVFVRVATRKRGPPP